MPSRASDAESARPYDLVLFGATGFTGGLTAEWLAANAPEGLRWALAGRSQEKLERVRDRLAAISPATKDLDLLVADVTDAAALADVVGRTKVVVTTIGPYLHHGEPLVAACAEAGTDYADLTGEPEFVDRMFLAWNERATETGARIVHACGFDSVPHDLGAWFTVTQLAERLGGEISTPVTMRGVVRAGGTFSGGTFHSAMAAMSRARQMRAAMQDRRKAEPRPVGRKSRAVGGKPRRDKVLDRWLLPLPTIDPMIVARSGAALDAYGPDFRYTHFAGTKTLPMAVGGGLGVSALALAAQVGPVRNLMLSKVPQGSGPDASRREKSWFTVDFVAETTGTGAARTVHTRVSGGDPGYGDTAKMLGSAGLCLALDDNPPTAGQVTTAQAMAANLLPRLEAAGIRFEVVD